MRKIVHIDNSTAVTGAYKALLSWCLSTPEFEHVWVLPEGSQVAAEARKRFIVYTLPFVEISRSPAKLLKYLPALWANGRRLKHIIAREQPDVLHLNDLYNLTPYAAQLSGKKRLPLVVHARMLRRSFPGRIYDFWKAWHLKRADRIIAVSEAIKRDWDNDARVQVIYDPIVVSEKLPPYVFPEQPDGPFRFLYLANYIAGKGQMDALQAVEILKKEGVGGFKVNFFGGTMGLGKNRIYKESLEAFVKEKSLSGLVALNDAVSDVEALMKSYQAALHFSHSESFGMVCYEALCYGLPVISSDCGGPAEMMIPGVSGILLPVGDVAGFAAAMRRFIQQPEQCSALSAASKDFIRKKFSDSTALSDLFRSVVR